MASTSTLGSRRNAAQLRALAGVERELRANDSSGRRKYLRDFRDAFRSYESLIDSQQLGGMVNAADIILIGDYHALPAAQRYAATLLEERAQPGDRPVVLGVETIFSRHQHVLEEWWRRKIDEAELRERVRFDADWGYDWAPFFELLVTAREHAEAIYGLDCMPRGDLRRATTHDRHAAEKLAEISSRHPDAVIIVLFGESHLAPGHLPLLLRQKLGGRHLLTVLQNVDSLYWRAAAELCESASAVRVSDDVVCVFNSTPLEKYENYRLCLERWSGNGEDPLDLSPAAYNVLEGILRSLNINQYSSSNGTRPKFLVDLLPEVQSNPSEEQLRRVLGGQTCTEGTLSWRFEEHGCVYVPVSNTIYIREFRTAYVAEEMARFVYHACRGLPLRGCRVDPIDSPRALYELALENCLGYVGSRLLCPVRPAIHEDHFPTAEEPLLMLDPLKPSLRKSRPECVGQQVGYKMGSSLYEAYVDGRVTKCSLRSFFVGNPNHNNSARELCLWIQYQFVRRQPGTRSSGPAVLLPDPEDKSN